MVHGCFGNSDNGVFSKNGEDEQGRFTKVVLSVASEADLLTIHQTAQEHGVPTALITDSGRTEFGGVPTRTTVAVGPAPAVLIDPITGRAGVVPTKLA